MKVWIRGRSASLIAPQAASMSRLVGAGQAADRPGPRPRGRSPATASKSPGEVIGKPASITSTPSRASCWAISTFSCVFSEMPGDCSPSRSVVSKMWTRFCVRSVPAAPARQRSSADLLLLETPMTFVSRGSRAAQRYSPRRGRRRRSARLSAGASSGRDSSGDGEACNHRAEASVPHEPRRDRVPGRVQDRRRGDL